MNVSRQSKTPIMNCICRRAKLPIAILIIGLVALAPAKADSQQAPNSGLTLKSEVFERSHEFDVDRAVGHAVFLGGLGFAVGYAAYMTQEGTEIGGAYLSGLAGATLGIPLGVWFSDDREGSFVDPLLGSLAIGFIGLLTQAAVPVALLAAPAGQIAVSIALQHRQEP